MKSRKELENDILKSYKLRIHNTNSAMDKNSHNKNIFLKNKLNYYYKVIDNFDSFSDELIKEVINNVINKILKEIYRGTKVINAVRLIDTGLCSLGIVERDIELLEMLRRFEFAKKVRVRDEIFEFVYSHFGLKYEKDEKKSLVLK